MDNYVHRVYDFSEKFPKNEMFGVASQIRRSALSVILNYIEGYARIKNMVHKNFLEISYGSLKESKYLIQFTFKRNFLSLDDYRILDELSEEIGRMLWGTMSQIK